MTNKSVVKHDPIIPLLTAKQALTFLSRVDDKRGADACWPWCGAVTPRGYGQFSIWNSKRKINLPRYPNLTKRFWYIPMT